MSTGLFKSKQFKSKKNLKDLLISPPVLDNSSNTSFTQTSPFRQTVVLRAVYDFTAESECETSITRGTYLKLLDKPGDGWLYVQVLDQLQDRKGLVPASYVEIEVNDSVSPVSKEWLCETSASNTPVSETMSTASRSASSSPQLRDNQFNSYTHIHNPSVSGSLDEEPRSVHAAEPVAANTFVFENIFVDSSPHKKMPKLPVQLTIDTNIAQLARNSISDDDFNFFQKGSMLPVQSPVSRLNFKSISITNVLQFDNRFYYRIDVVLSNKTKRYVMKTYQDFYNLHINLSVLNINEKTLPKLPQPIRQQTKSSLLIRCNELNVYLNKLTKNSFFKNCDEFVLWLDMDKKAQKIIDSMAKYDADDDDVINQILLPNSVDMISQQSKSKYSTTAPLPPTVSAEPMLMTLPSRTNNNMKYSSYMNQGSLRKPSNATQSSSNTTTPTSQRFPHLTSSNTLELYGSLIDRYDAFSETMTNRSQSICLSFDNLNGPNPNNSIHEDDELEEEDEEPRRSSSDSDSLFSGLKDTPSTPVIEHTEYKEDISTSPITPGTPPLAGNSKQEQPQRFSHQSQRSISSSQPQLQTHFRSVSITLDKQLPPSPTRVKLSEYVKVKVVLNNQEDDIIVVKVLKKQLHHINDLKRIVSEKIYKDSNLINHYSFELDGILDQYEIMQCLLERNKVNLKLIRIRQ